MKTKKRILSLLLAFCLLTGLMPTMAFAEEPTVSVWDGSSVADDYESGNGTEDSPYEIASAEQFAYFAQRISSGYETEAYYVLSCDLDLSAANWTPIGGYPDNIFEGTFDGRGHTIRYVISSYSPTGPYYSFIGLFEYVEGDISNLDVEGSITLPALEREVSLGGLSGVFGGNITNCDSNVDITYASNQGAVWIGGLIGQYRAGTIQECAYTGEISAMDNTGQAVAGGNCGAFHGGTIDSCKNAGRITCETNDLSAIDVAGGIVGLANTPESDVTGTIRNCYNEGAVSGNYVGGIIGYVDAYKCDIFVENCYSSTMASGTAAQGALIGQNDEGAGSLKVQNCYYLTGTDYYGSKAADLNEIYEKLSESSQGGIWKQDASGVPRLYWEYVVAPDPTTYTLLVDLQGGSGSAAGGEYAEGAVINIDAGTRANYRFTGWTSSNGGSFADASSQGTTFTMPADDTTITANWQYDVGTGKAVQIGALQIKGGQASSVYFGNYQQSDTTGNTKEPVRWRVLSDADGKLLLLSDQNLDVQPYNSSHTSITWENCTLRTWLNGMFLTAAFSNDEQGAIAQTYVDNADNPTYNTPGGNDTTDKIFLLSIEEANNSSYFPNGNSSRISTNTAYTASRNTSMSGAGGEDWWWLRSPGGYALNAAVVDTWGEVFYLGYGVEATYYALRPAFNLNLNSVLFTSAAAGSGHISFGTAIPDYSGSEWKVTLKDDNDFSSGASVSGTTSLMEGYSDTTLTISHAALSSLSGDYTDVTAALTDASGSLLYYGSINSSTTATESTVTIPAGLSEGTYTLSIYGEDWNGANGTDYATGTPYTVTLTVDNIPPSYSISTSSSRLYFQSATEGYLGGEAWYVTVTNTGNQNVTVALPASTNYTITAQRGFTGGTADLAPDGTARFSVGPKTGLAAGSYNETLTISGSNGASASIELYFTVTHSYGTDWETDADKHWHECSCGAKTDEAEHEYDDEQDTTCNVCGYVRTVAPVTYPLTVELNGGSGSTTGGEYAESDVIQIDAGTRSGYRFSGWTSSNGGSFADASSASTTFTMPAADTTITALWLDVEAPTGEIKIGENGWRTFLNHITFGLFFKDTQTVTITADDNSGETVTIEYLLSDKALTEDELAGKTFTAYSAPFYINPDNEYIIYAKLTDTSGKVAYINTDGIVLDATVPVISGIENGKTYCAAQTVTITEEYIDTVTVNGKEVTLDSNNQFILNPSEGTQTIVVTDKAGNVPAEMIVTVNNGHTDENPKDHICDICTEKISSHSGGTATCTDKAVCEYCGAEYGDVDASNHASLVKTEAKAATCTEDGNTEYWTCDTCGKHFSDAEGKTEIALADTVISATDHKAGTVWKSDENGHWNECVNCGDKMNEAAHTYEWVTDKEPTATEAGSRHEECKICGYAKAAVKIPATGTAEEPSEPSKPGETPSEPSKDTNTPTGDGQTDDTTSPQTGDNSNMILWLALAAVSGGTLSVIASCKKRKAA